MNNITLLLIYLYHLILAAIAVGGYAYTGSGWCFLALVLYLVPTTKKEKREPVVLEDTVYHVEQVDSEHISLTKRE